MSIYRINYLSNTTNIRNRIQIDRKSQLSLKYSTSRYLFYLLYLQEGNSSVKMINERKKQGEKNRRKKETVFTYFTCSINFFWSYYATWLQADLSVVQYVIIRTGIKAEEKERSHEKRVLCLGEGSCTVWPCTILRTLLSGSEELAEWRNAAAIGCCLYTTVTRYSLTDRPMSPLG